MTPSSTSDDVFLRQLTDEQLVATVLSARPRCARSTQHARQLLSDVDGLRGLVRASKTPQRFEAFQGYAGRRLLAAIELGLRCAEPYDFEGKIVESSTDVVAVMGPRLRYHQTEQVWMIGLDARGALMFRTCIAKGGQLGCGLLTRDVLRVAVQLGPDAFVLVHNHPTGDPRPSQLDVDTTKHLLWASLQVGVPLLDHVIIAKEGHQSLLESGLMPEPIGAMNPLAVDPFVPYQPSSSYVGSVSSKAMPKAAVPARSKNDSLRNTTKG